MQVNQKAPVFQSSEIFIHARPEHIWTLLTDIDRWSEWQPKITRANLTGHPTVGATFNWKINGASIRSIIQTVEIAQLFGWSGTTFGGSAIHNWYLEPKNGGTVVRVVESMDGWLVRLFKNKMNRDLASDMVFWLEKLKDASTRAASVDITQGQKNQSHQGKTSAGLK